MIWLLHIDVHIKLLHDALYYVQILSLKQNISDIGNI